MPLPSNTTATQPLRLLHHETLTPHEAPSSEVVRRSFGGNDSCPPPGEGSRFRRWLATRADRRRERQLRRFRGWALSDPERGAVTAEYALVILAAVAFAGVLIAIMRSGEVRSLLTQLVQNALNSAG